MAFTGIPTAALDFYEQLEADNSKTFWTAHKAVYDEAVRAPLADLAAELEPEFGAAKLFRPYRDVRFSADKTPYKTAQGAWFEDAGVYVQVSAAGMMLGAGMWRSTSDQVARLRAAVHDSRTGGELADIVGLLRADGYQIGGDQLTRVPAGYPKDSPRADLLRHKTLTAHRDVGAPDWLSTPEAKEQIADSWRTMLPLVHWLREHVGGGLD